MKMNIRKRYEMIMSQEELEVLMMICSPEEYAYGYRCISESEEEWLVETEDEDLIEEIEETPKKKVNTKKAEVEEDKKIEQISAQEIDEDIEDILSCLKDKDKELFIKYYIEGYKLCEIAKKDKTNVTNLHSRLSRGRKRIKERFKVQGGINYEK